MEKTMMRWQEMSIYELYGGGGGGGGLGNVH